MKPKEREIPLALFIFAISFFFWFIGLFNNEDFSRSLEEYGMKANAEI